MLIYCKHSNKLVQNKCKLIIINKTTYSAFIKVEFEKNACVGPFNCVKHSG